MKSSDKNKYWLKKLKALNSVVGDITPNKAWRNGALVSETLSRVCKSFEKDMEALEKEALFMFSSQTESDDHSQQGAEILRKWQLVGAPSLSSICIFALESFGVEPREDALQAILIASVLGEVENDLSYHNNMHYRKVLFNVIRLVTVHNYIYEGTARSFDTAQIGLLMIAACIHDLGHDGLGNTVKGVFTQGRLEQRSCALAVPYLRAVGYDDESALDDLKIMVLCTEVTPLDDPGNPMNQLKAAYRYHYLGDKTKTHTLNLDPDIAALEMSPHLAMTCLILHEADIATSAGLTYDVTKYETSIYMEEIGTKHARPQHVIDFLNQICQRSFLSDAAQRLYAGNLARIYALAQEDVDAGDELYAKPDHSDFLLTLGRENGAKTIN